MRGRKEEENNGRVGGWGRWKREYVEEGEGTGCRGGGGRGEGIKRRTTLECGFGVGGRGNMWRRGRAQGENSVRVWEWSKWKTGRKEEENSGRVWGVE